MEKAGYVENAMNYLNNKPLARRALPRYSPDLDSDPNFDPNRTERIVLSFRDEKDRRKRELSFSLPSRLSLPFHWWMMTRGFVKV